MFSSTSKGLDFWDVRHIPLTSLAVTISTNKASTNIKGVPPSPRMAQVVHATKSSHSREAIFLTGYHLQMQTPQSHMVLTQNGLYWGKSTRMAPQTPQLFHPLMHLTRSKVSRAGSSGMDVGKEPSLELVRGAAGFVPAGSKCSHCIPACLHAWPPLTVLRIKASCNFLGWNTTLVLSHTHAGN